jgi:hypothetical protein
MEGEGSLPSLLSVHVTQGIQTGGKAFSSTCRTGWFLLSEDPENSVAHQYLEIDKPFALGVVPAWGWTLTVEEATVEAHTTAAHSAREQMREEKNACLKRKRLVHGHM